jgi:hypothetical protein
VLYRCSSYLLPFRRTCYKDCHNGRHRDRPRNCRTKRRRQFDICAGLGRQGDGEAYRSKDRYAHPPLYLHILFDKLPGQSMLLPHLIFDAVDRVLTKHTAYMLPGQLGQRTNIEQRYPFR